MNSGGRQPIGDEYEKNSEKKQMENGLPTRLRILVVEDDEVTRMVTSRLLQKKGYVVETAANGQKALALLGNDIFDLVLMDISMPKIDGLALERHIKKNSKTRNIPVVAVTAYASDEDQKRLLAQGMNGFIAKPVNPEELLKTIVQLTSSSCDVIDREGLILRTDGDREFIKEVVELFCQTSPEIISKINNSSDLQNVNELAHKLQGAAETVGAKQIINIAHQIKIAAQAGEWQEISNGCQLFEPALDLFKQSLAEWGIILSNNGL
ncbi:MAG: response regulator [Syntrophomonas sp.]